MLDSVTKRRIDSARDILVGKVPDPKSQVEQITIALIYKFMDDMDAAAEEVGGKRKFFAGDFEKYGWAKLMAQSTSGEERIALYAEGMLKMTQNPDVPKLFRDIFKNAFLPYRDPETLKLFLKEIDGFTYDHSERLGDAFEYLLSVLGSQGDAGQFRTPRHIIDFVVKVVDPKKTDTILDPACGTAGFLISAYKHIEAANRDDHGKTTLTGDERKKLAENLRGYDISPDMVRLSLVNLYLHGFPNPKVEEYDTLTSQDKWSETADVILANPPFMSPKGGIKPHDKFSVKSKRSEVLFVDYIAEHLSPTGRAGVIVPEGIIFQSQNAYVALRKLLVEKYLVAVVSLPAGLFQPYSGVKTSILLFDKAISKQTETIGFFKITKDGYALGAQRRPLCADKGESPEHCPDHSDLPALTGEIAEYLRRLRSRETLDGFTTTLGLVVPKEEIRTNGEYNLSGDRYRATGTESSAFRMVSLSEICRLTSGGTPSKANESYWKGPIPWVSAKDLKCDEISDAELHISEEAARETATSIAPIGSLLVLVRGMGLANGIPIVEVKSPCAFNQDIRAIHPTQDVLPTYLRHILKSDRGQLAQVLNTAAHGTLKIDTKDLLSLRFPLPPLAVQKEIVAEIEGYQRVMGGARAVLDHYRPHIPANPNWREVLVGDIIELASGRFLPVAKTIPGPYLVYGGNGSDRTHNEYFVDEPTVVIGRVGFKCGAVHLTAPKSWITDNVLYVTRLKLAIDQQFLAFALTALNLNRFASTADLRSISQATIYSKTIPLPPLAEQQRIVAEIKAEQRLVDGNRDLIERFEKKSQETLALVWGEAVHDV